MNKIKNLGFFAFLIKIGPLFLKLLKTLKSVKLALAAGSMVAYSYLFTWEFALILLLSIVFHEYGHITAMKKCGMKTKGIYLIPFLGGAAVPEEGFKNRRDETYTALYGPWYGLLLTIPFLIYGIIFESPLAIGLVSFMALINLFNLFPINPLDGGRVIKSIGFSINDKLGLIVMVLGILLAILGVVLFKIWILLFVIIIGVLELYFEYKEYKKEIKLINKEDYINNLNNQYIEEEKEELYLKYLENRNNKLNKNMNKMDLKRYSIYYVGLVMSFVGLIIFTGQYEGADLALKFIMDDL